MFLLCACAVCAAQGLPPPSAEQTLDASELFAAVTSHERGEALEKKAWLKVVTTNRGHGSAATTDRRRGDASWGDRRGDGADGFGDGGRGQPRAPTTADAGEASLRPGDAAAASPSGGGSNGGTMEDGAGAGGGDAIPQPVQRIFHSEGGA